MHDYSYVQIMQLGRADIHHMSVFQKMLVQTNIIDCQSYFCRSWL